MARPLPLFKQAFEELCAEAKTGRYRDVAEKVSLCINAYHRDDAARLDNEITDVLAIIWQRPELVDAVLFLDILGPYIQNPSMVELPARFLTNADAVRTCLIVAHLVEHDLSILPDFKKDHALKLINMSLKQNDDYADEVSVNLLGYALVGTQWAALQALYGVNYIEREDDLAKCLRQIPDHGLVKNNAGEHFSISVPDLLS